LQLAPGGQAGMGPYSMQVPSGCLSTCPLPGGGRSTATWAVEDEGVAVGATASCGGGLRGGGGLGAVVFGPPHAEAAKVTTMGAASRAWRVVRMPGGYTDPGAGVC
jgi:hypothetical protein